jgi:hypothetical protein
MNSIAIEIACKENGQVILGEMLAHILCQLNSIELELVFYW